MANFYCLKVDMVHRDGEKGSKCQGFLTAVISCSFKGSLEKGGITLPKLCFHEVEKELQIVVFQPS